MGVAGGGDWNGPVGAVGAAGGATCGFPRGGDGSKRVQDKSVSGLAWVERGPQRTQEVSPSTLP